MKTVERYRTWIIILAASFSASYDAFGEEAIRAKPQAAEAASEGLDTPQGNALGASFERVRRLIAHPEVEWGAGAAPGGIALGSNANTDKVLHAMAASGDPGTRVRAVEAWSQSQDSQALELLLGALEDADPAVRETAVQGLYASKTASTVEGQDVVFRHVLRTMSGAAGPAQASLDAALPELGAILGGPMLEAFLSDETAIHDKEVLAYCLGRMAYRPAAAGLAAGIQAPERALSYACAEALCALHDPSTALYWVGLLSHHDPAIREGAVDALAELGAPQGFEALSAIARGEVPSDTRLEARAVRALARYPAEQAIPALIAVMHRNARGRRLASQLLRECTGMDLGEKPEAWEAWYAGIAPEAPEMPGIAPESPPVFDLEVVPAF